MSQENYKKIRLIEDEWIMQMADFEDGCSVNAGSLDPEYFFKKVEENRKLSEQILDEIGVTKIPSN